jgi:DNA-binding transcriptional LysR family regulator
VLDWNDLKWFVAVADAGSFRLAAAETKVNHTTLSRRLKVLEEELGVTLFERSPAGLVITEAGEELRHSCETVIEAIADMQDRMAGKDQRAEGRVSLTYAASLAPLVMDAVAKMRDVHPMIQIVHLNREEFVELGHNQADVAVRAVSNPPEHLRGRRLGRLRWSVYGAKTRYPEPPAKLVPSEHDWVGLGGRWAKAPPVLWLSEAVPASQLHGEADDPQTVRELVASGLGLGLLMTIDGDRDPRLTCIGPWPGPSPPAYLWLLLHPDTGRARRVRVVTDFLFDYLRRMDGLYEASA